MSTVTVLGEFLSILPRHSSGSVNGDSLGRILFNHTKTFPGSVYGDILGINFHILPAVSTEALVGEPCRDVLPSTLNGEEIS